MKQVLKIRATWTRFKSTLGNEQPFAIDVKGGGKASNRIKGPKRQAEEVYCHQCQRGRLLEMLSLMEIEATKIETGKGDNKEVNEGSKGDCRNVTVKQQRQRNKHNEGRGRAQPENNEYRGRDV